MSEQSPAEGAEQTEQPSHEENMIRKSVESGHVKVPDQFLNNEDPVKAWVDSYKNTKAALTQAQQKLAEVTKSRQTKTEETIDNFDPAAALEEAVEENSEEGGVDWASVQKEIASTGGMSAETRKALHDMKVPDYIIDAAVSGFKAQQRELAAKAAEVMGGVDRMKKVIDWAKKSLPQAEREALSAQLRQPGWQMTLRGLSAQYDEANKNSEPKQDIQSESASSDGGALPWSSPQEMTAAMSDPRYKYRTDAEFVKKVEARCRASYGKQILRNR